MASSALGILSGIAAAAAGLAGDKVPKSGAIPGLDVAAIIPALLGKTGGGSGLMGTLASVATKTGVLNSSNLTQLAGTLLSSAKSGAAKSTAQGGIAELAAAICSGSDQGAVASLASKLGKTASSDKERTGMASELGKTLSNSFGVSLNAPGTAVKALDKVLGSDAKAGLFKAVLKGIA